LGRNELTPSGEEQRFVIHEFSSPIRNRNSEILLCRLSSHAFPNLLPPLRDKLPDKIVFVCELTGSQPESTSSNPPALRSPSEKFYEAFRLASLLNVQRICHADRPFLSRKSGISEARVFQKLKEKECIFQILRLTVQPKAERQRGVAAGSLPFSTIGKDCSAAG